MVIENILNSIKKLPKAAVFSLAVLLVSIIGFFDYITGYKISFSLFYLFPIILITWFASGNMGVLFAFLSAGVWILVDIFSRIQAPLSLPIITWNAIVRLGFFLIIVGLLDRVKKSLDNEKKSSRIDYLTGLANSRFFYELADIELERAKRYKLVFSIVYMDVDDFKKINDRFGHKTGDLCLRTIADAIKDSLRKIDLVSRLAGDEFSIILPETEHEQAIQTIGRIKKDLTELMKEKGWGVGFSWGILTCISAPDSVEEMISKADSLMYEAKRKGKNTIEAQIYKG